LELEQLKIFYQRQANFVLVFFIATKWALFVGQMAK
jgi:hypothetical protein